MTFASLVVGGGDGTEGPTSTPGWPSPERNLGISIEMLALFVRFWLTPTRPVAEASRAAAQAKGAERFEGFVAALGRGSPEA